MSPMKWLDHFLFLEKLLGICRNYHSQKKTKKYFIIFQISVQFMLHTFILINEEHFLLGRQELDPNKLMHGGFAAVCFVNALSSIVAGICYSRAYMSFIRSTSRVFECFQDDKFHGLKKIYWFSITCTVLCMLFSLYRSTHIFINYMQMGGDRDMFTLVSGFTLQTLLRFIIKLENIVFFFVIMIVVQLVKCLKSTISEVQERVGRCDISSDEQCDITREQIQEWVELYRDLTNCCEKVTLCFGRQVHFIILR